MGGLLSAHVLAQDARFMQGYTGALLDKALDLGPLLLSLTARQTDRQIALLKAH
jgi:hypothetical protein